MKRLINRAIWIFSLVVVSTAPQQGFSASLYTETFIDSTAGWQDRDVAKMSVTNVLTGGNPGGALRGFFGPQVGPPTFESDAFIATGRLATANFVGDYDEVDAWLLGFDFMASNIVPSAFVVQIYSGTNVIIRSLTDSITTTGVWHSFKLSLLDARSGGWEGSTTAFYTILANVTRVEFRITRNAEGSQFYYLDNIFLDRLPDAVDMTGDAQTWLHMRNGANYRYEAASSLVPPDWSLIQAFTATTSVYITTFPRTNDWRYYRMTMD